MQFRVEYDKRPPIRAMVMEDEAAPMCEHLDIYRDPNTCFCVVLKGALGREMRAAPLGTGSGDRGLRFRLSTLCACERRWHKLECTIP